MLFDTYIKNKKGHWLVAYGPRKVVGEAGDTVVEECPSEDAAFWGVYRYDQEGLAAHVGDAGTQAEADALATVVAAEVSWSQAGAYAAKYLPGEHYLVVDGRGRAYCPLGQLFKLELPRQDFGDTRLMWREQAEMAANRLAEIMPEAGPYCVLDGVQYAQQRALEAAAAHAMMRGEPVIAGSADPDDVLNTLRGTALGASLAREVLPRDGTMTVVTGSGDFTVSRKTGKILYSTGVSEGGNPTYFNSLESQIDRFDVAEFYRWCAKSDVEPASSISLSGVGYWVKSDTPGAEPSYKDPSSRYRAALAPHLPAAGTVPAPTTDPTTAVMTVRARRGEFTVDRKTGAILSSYAYSSSDDHRYFEPNIAQFDVGEYERWCEAVGLAPRSSVDIACLGHWTKPGMRCADVHYKAAGSAYRELVLERVSEVVYRFPRGHAEQYCDMLGHLRDAGFAPRGRAVTMDGKREWLISIAERKVSALEQLKVARPEIFADPLRTPKHSIEPQHVLVVHLTDTATAAFRDTSRMVEITRILGDASNRIVVQARVAQNAQETRRLGERTPYGRLADFVLTDLNGNAVGTVSIRDTDPTGHLEAPTGGSVILYLPLPTHMDHPSGLLEAARSLRVASSMMADGSSEDLLLDERGDPVGRFAVGSGVQTDLHRRPDRDAVAYHEDSTPGYA